MSLEPAKPFLMPQTNLRRKSSPIFPRWVKMVTPVFLTIAFFALIFYMVKYTEINAIICTLVTLTAFASGIAWAKNLE